MNTPNTWLQKAIELASASGSAELAEYLCDQLEIYKNNMEFKTEN